MPDTTHFCWSICYDNFTLSSFPSQHAREHKSSERGRQGNKKRNEINSKNVVQIKAEIQMFKNKCKNKTGHKRY